MRSSLPGSQGAIEEEKEAVDQAFLETSDGIQSDMKPYAELFMIEHAMRSTFVVAGRVLQPQQVPAPVPTIPCVAMGCVRCQNLRGGYQFKWYSRLWGDEYRRSRRPGAWTPGEPEA